MDAKKMIRYFWVTVAAATLLLSSCTKEDLSVCVVQTTFTFKYAYPKIENNSEFPTPVKGARLFVFDNASRRLVTEREVLSPVGSVYDSFSVTVDLEPGTYSIVAWAGEDNSQLTTAVSSNGVVTHSAFVPGETTLEEALLAFAQTTQQAERMLSADVTNRAPLNLFHGDVQEVELTRGRENEVTVTLTKVSHDVIVTVNDLRTEAPNASSCEVSASLLNSMLTFQREIPQTAQSVQYIPHTIEDQSESVCRSTISVLRMRSDMEGDLVVKDRRDNTELFRKSLIREIIARHPNVSSNPTTHLEKYSTYEIELNVTDSKVIISITVDNWTVRLVDTDI